MTSDEYAQKRIHLFDGSFDTGFRITGFTISQSNREDTDLSVVNGIITTEEIATTARWDWGDNRQLAWARNVEDGNYPANATPYSIIDPDNIIVEDLYIGMYIYGDLEKDVNYLITMDKYDITEWEGALAIVRNSSQG